MRIAALACASGIHHNSVHMFSALSMDKKHAPCSMTMLFVYTIGLCTVKHLVHSRLVCRRSQLFGLCYAAMCPWSIEHERV